MRGYANKATGPARLHQLSGAALAAHARKVAKKKRGKKGGKKKAKKRGKKKAGKKRGKKRAKKKTGYTTKVQVGRKKVRARVKNKEDSLVVSATAHKTAKGKKRVVVRVGVHKGRKVRLPS